MLLIPYGTDAPIYYRPYATVGLIVVNVVLSLVLSHAVTQDVRDRLALSLGQGFHPLEWITHLFLHAGLVHVVGSMVMLWVFGLIVEGKVGPLWFLGSYLGIGMLHGATVQAVGWRTIPQTFDTFGSEAAVCGILGMAVAWAPLNTITTIWAGRTFAMWYVEVYEIPVALFAAMAVVWNIFTLVLRHIGGLEFFGMALGNLSGVAWGIMIGSAMLAAKLVDCEGWDLYRVLTRRAGRIQSARKKSRRRGPQSSLLRERFALSPKKGRIARNTIVEDAPELATIEPVSLSAADRIQREIDEGRIDEALRIYDKTARVVPAWPTDAEALRLIKSLHRRNLLVESIPMMRDYCRNYPESADRVRLKLAQILIRDREHPTHALRVLEEIREGSLPDSLETVRLALVKQAQHMVNDGVLELEGED